MSAFIRRKIWSRTGRIARFEPLENRLLLTTSRGLDPAAFDALKADWPGFEYSGIVAESVLVVDATNGIDAQTLRQAIAEAKSNAGPDLIVIQTENADAASLRFDSSDDVFKIDDASPLTIVANGPQKLTIDANGKSRVFEVSDVSTLALGSVALTGGAALDGGAILNSGTLFLDGVYVAANDASRNGGGIYNESNLTVVNSIITDNRAGANGGGVYSTGVYVEGAALKNANFIACDVVGNAAGVDGNGLGGGIYFAGQDADFNIFAEMRLDASIVVQNRSSSTECDVNIYNSAFYNEIEIDGELFVVELPVAALIDGDYNVTSFAYWVSSYNPDEPSAAGTNRIYREATPLFVRDYNFETRTVGDYALYESELSQAIDKAPRSVALYPNGRPLVRDFAGKRRVQNGALDAGALEVKAAQIDLATTGGARTSAKATVVGGRLRLENVAASNLSDEETGEFKLQFFASENLTFEPDSDVLVGELDGLRLAPNLTQTFRSNELATELLTPGVAYYFYWRIVSDADAVAANNVGATTESVVFYAENDAEITAVPLEFDNYRTQRDSMFYLAVSPKAAERFGDGFAYWWDYGDGRFVRGATGDWIVSASSDDWEKAVVALKVVDETSGKVVAKGSAALETTWTAPTIACDVRETANDATLILTFALQGEASRAIREWQIAWGDGSTSTFGALSSALTVGHCYTTSAEAKTHSISLTVVEAGSQARKTTYRLFDFKVAGTVSSAVLTSEAVDERATPTIPAERTESRAVNAPTIASSLGETPVEKASSLESTLGETTGLSEGRKEVGATLESRSRPASAPIRLSPPLDAIREVWKRREWASLFDESDEGWENALELLAFNVLR